MSTRLRELRRRAGMTQEELARAADVATATIQKWEQARRTMMVEAARKVAKALGVSLDVLVGDAPLPRRKGNRP